MFPFNVIKPSEHMRSCLLWFNFCCLLLCTTQIHEIEIYVHPSANTSEEAMINFQKVCSSSKLSWLSPLPVSHEVVT
jgi:hypothetical protein